jgi:hypothetical protein
MHEGRPYAWLSTSVDLCIVVCHIQTLGEGTAPSVWPSVGDGLAREGSIVAPGAWKWLAGVVSAARRGLGLLPGASGAEVVAAAWWWCGLPTVGWGAAG